MPTSPEKIIQKLKVVGIYKNKNVDPIFAPARLQVHYLGPLLTTTNERNEKCFSNFCLVPTFLLLKILD